MPNRPLIGIATQSLEAVPGKLPACWVMGQRYVRTLTAAGALPWLIPLLPPDEETLRLIYDRLDGVFLTGGVDLDPSSYGEEKHERCDRTDPDRDWTELNLVRWAVEDNKPVLGVCRGIQAINVACGGSLHQDIGAQLPAAMKHDYFPQAPDFSRDYLAHTVEVKTASQLAELLGAGELPVNSMHHQAIKKLAHGFEATVFSPDGLIEGIEKPDHAFLVGVQWHPEELADRHPPMKRLFEAFVEACTK